MRMESGKIPELVTKIPEQIPPHQKKYFFE
jgi:hypothetical protein